VSLLSIDTNSAGAEEGRSFYKSGYQAIPDSVGSASSVVNQLKTDDKVKRSHLGFNPFREATEPYFEFKRHVQDEYGLAFGFDYNSLAQWSTSSITDIKSAYGGVFRQYGNWSLVNRNGKDTGSLVWRIENRSAYEDSIAPLLLGPEIGLNSLTTTVFDGYGWGITNLQWEQHFNSNKVFVVIGQVDVTDWYDIFAFGNPWTDFKNSAIEYANLTPPLQGWGGMALSMFGEHFYGRAGLSDANGFPTRWGYETFVEVHEYFTYGEVGFVSDQENLLYDNVHISFWHQDPKTFDDFTPEGWGLNFSASWRLGDQWLPFFRAGWSDGGGGAPAELGFTAGAGIELPNDDGFSFALNWSKPASQDLRESVTLETYYRFQMLPNVAIWPDLQVVFNPANNREVNTLAVLSMTARVSF
jgi:porin